MTRGICKLCGNPTDNILGSVWCCPSCTGALAGVDDGIDFVEGTFELPIPVDYGDRTLHEARAQVEQAAWDGIECPCCGQLAKIYKRKFNSNMAVFLISLVQMTLTEPNGWVHHSQCKYRGRDYSYIEAWGLAGTRPSRDSEKRMSGYWKPTPMGLAFTMEQLLIPSHIHLYNNIVVGVEQTKVTIRDALGDKFNYDELMGARGE